MCSRCVRRCGREGAGPLVLRPPHLVGSGPGPAEGRGGQWGDLAAPGRARPAMAVSRRKAGSVRSATLAFSERRGPPSEGPGPRPSPHVGTESTGCPLAPGRQVASPFRRARTGRPRGGRSNAP